MLQPVVVRVEMGNTVEIGGHDFFMGLGLMASAVLTVAYVRAPSSNLRIFALIGAAATVVIGALLFFGVA